MTNSSEPVAPLRISSLPSEVVPIEWVIPQRQNANKHPPKQREKIRASLIEFGQVRSVLVRLLKRTRGKNPHPVYEAIAGSGLLTEMIEVGFREVKIERVQFDEPKAIAYALTDNAIPKFNEWDDEIVNAQLKMLSGEDFNVAAIGFDETELSKRLHDSLAEDSEAAKEAARSTLAAASSSRPSPSSTRGRDGGKSASARG